MHEHDPILRAPDDTASIATIHWALDFGFTYFGTAEAYGPFTNKRLLSRALAHTFDGVKGRPVVDPV